MKKIFTFAVLATAMLMVSCNKQPSKMEAQTDANSNATQGISIAYVQVDSVQEHYEFAKLINDSLENMAARAQSVLSNKAKQLERSGNSIQTKLQNNGFTSEEQYKNAVAAFQQEQNNYAALEARLGKELQDKQLELSTALKDSVDHFLVDYNKDKKFDLILRSEVLLHAESKFDITQDVINGLNQRYKK